MKITFLNQKGGVGKSHIALLVAGTLAKANHKVAIDDRDEQGTLTHWTKTVGNVPLLKDCPEADFTIIDTPGHLKLDNNVVHKQVARTIEESDRLILVTEMSDACVHGSVIMAAMISEYKRKDAAAKVLFNKVRKQTLIGQRSQKDLAKILKLPALKHYVPLSAAYERAYTAGWGEITGKDRETILMLTMEILSK